MNQADGVYSWSYRLDTSVPNPVFRSMLIVCGIIGLVMCVASAFMGMILIGLILLAGMVGLPAIGWIIMSRLTGGHTTESYRMTDRYVWVSTAYKKHHFYYGEIRDVILRPEEDLIELHTFALAVVHVFVGREDYEFVRDYILARVRNRPAQAEKRA